MLCYRYKHYRYTHVKLNFVYNILFHQRTKCDMKNSKAVGYKKDGYRQQNVRQRQKLISIIDYDVCILEYLVIKY